MSRFASPLHRLYEPGAYQTTELPSSFWADSVGTLPACQALSASGTLKTDIAIIGGGYTGLSAALHLAQSGRSVSVFEASRPGWGASGRNGGFCCLGGSMQSWAGLAKQFGNNASRQFAQHQLAAINLVDHRVSDWQADVDRHSDGEMVLAHKAGRVRDLHAEAHELAHFADIKSTFHTAESLQEQGMNAHGIAGGLHVKAGFGLHPFKYLAALHKACLAAGVQIFEQAEIQRIDDNGDTVTLTSDDCRIIAENAIIATNGYSAENLPGWLAGRLLPVISGILVTRPLNDSEWREQGWTSDMMAYDTRVLLHYFRKLPDGRFMFGGRGGLNATQEGQQKARATLIDEFHTMFPAWRDINITHHWNGLACLSQSLRPFVGQIPGHPRLWTSLAYHGNGVAMASYAGDLLARRITGDATAADVGPVMAVPPKRFPLAGLRRQYRWLAYAAYGFRDRFL
ncbi:NAD(P)/FAD-dependent oxidoreductase [Thalassospira mesophila]|uniref:FAD-dependent oxidoreductase n=1 Tax=Thalassospira mesophila TaxID=1293891 RepID=A0A1Y2L1Q9_9PROT|nr:FAD-binding oxidoreductase [Thalassospira mesophila]OSQ37994.1 FAD-dependent oxidoreductase [Thalassospira mesophila]